MTHVDLSPSVDLAIRKMAYRRDYAMSIEQMAKALRTTPRAVSHSLRKQGINLKEQRTFTSTWLKLKPELVANFRKDLEGQGLTLPTFVVDHPWTRRELRSRKRSET
jgi:hypothetical protein